MLLYRMGRLTTSRTSAARGLYGAGRWHHKGTRILYTSTIEPPARLEVLANYNIIPPNMKLLTLEIADSIFTFERVHSQLLRTYWRETNSYPPELAETALKCLQIKRSLVLMVSSVQLSACGAHQLPSLPAQVIQRIENIAFFDYMAWQNCPHQTVGRILQGRRFQHGLARLNALLLAPTAR